MPKDQYKKLLEETKNYYKSLKRIRCKHIEGEFIIFGNSGFTYLLIKGRKARSIDEQFRKLFLVRYIRQVVDSDKVKREVRIIESREYGQIEYLALSTEVDGRFVKIVLRKLGSGNYHFWSIMDQ